MKIREIRARAIHGEGFAQTLLGYLFEHGFGLSRDEEQAKHWYQVAAENGYPQAQYALALIVQKDKGEESICWLKKSAEQGFPPAQFILGTEYQEGVRTEKDLAEAVGWIQSAADQNYAPALSHLSYLYEEGIGVEANKKRAFSYLKSAAEAGNVSAAFRIGSEMVETGNEEMIEQGIVWIWRAAEQDHHFAKLFLARMYDMGLYGRKGNKELSEYFYGISKNINL
ncbi:MAG: tetratricopeptide repeat protein [Planctomycetota bacterium]|jgi:TPR repeat protein